ncbi:MAG: hypothetical protein ACFCGT_00495 [Sandaracinaceae bacterium]
MVEVVRRAVVIVAWAFAAWACGGTPAPEPVTAAQAPPPAPPPAVALEDDPVPDGPACSSTAECGEGACRGPAGCAVAWACGPPRACGDALVSYCGCDGETFLAQEACPGQPYAAVGPCDPLGELVADAAAPVEGNALCESSRDCRRGYACTGLPGCGAHWTCERRRRLQCGRARDDFCGCDGETFRASSRCPGRPFAHRGRCGEDGTGVAVAAADADAASEPTAASAPAPDRAAASSPPIPALAAASSPRRGARGAAAGASAGGPPAGSASTSPPPPGRSAAGSVAARACRTAHDCPPDMVCQGPPGCGAEAVWTCEPRPDPCIRDTQRFCSCGLQTFRASMNCPERPYLHRGSCVPEDRAGAQTP